MFVTGHLRVDAKLKCQPEQSQSVSLLPFVIEERRRQI
jgi:hypothetical protein